MTKLADVLGRFPFTVNVFGRKRDLIVKLGDALYKPKKLKEVYCRGRIMDLSNSEHFKILAYATNNFYRDFEESDLGHYMKQNLQMGDVFLDVGANLGGYSMLATDLGCETYAFEPVPDLYEVLKRNEKVYGTVSNVAVSDAEGTAEFFISDANVGGSSLVESESGWEKSGYARKVEVVTKSLDQLEQEEAIPSKIRLLKIDVEGNEQSVISGMRQIGLQHKIQTIWCEVRGDNSDRNPGTFRTVTRDLEAAGYKTYKWSDGQAVPFNVDTDSAPQFFDLLYEYHG